MNSVIVKIHTIATGVIRRLQSLSTPATPSYRHLDLVNSSSFFDRDWYLAQNQDVSRENMDPALHYLLHGVKEGRDPGPLFNTRLYLELHKDVARSGLNPLVHYILHGQSEGRSTCLPEVDRPVVLHEVPAITSPPLSFSLPKTAGKRWIRQSEIADDLEQNTLRLAGTVLGRLPTDISKATTNPFMNPLLMNITAYCRLLNIDHISNIRFFHGLNPVHITGISTGLQNTNTGPGLFFEYAESGFRIDDIWYKNDYELRIRFDSTVLNEDETPVIRFYQNNSSATAIKMSEEYLLDSPNISFVDVTLNNPYLPILITRSTRDGYLQSVSILPFPSLCRGGLHYSELCADKSDNSYTEKLAALSRMLLTKMLTLTNETSGFLVSRIKVDLRSATGAEPVFSTDFLRWLAVIMKVRVMPVDLTVVSSKKVSRYLTNTLVVGSGKLDPHIRDQIQLREKNGSVRLILPADAIPTLQSLVQIKSDHPVEKNQAVCPYIICDSLTMEPELLVSIPQMGSELLDLQPANVAIGYPLIIREQKDNDSIETSRMDRGMPFAIRFCHAANRNDSCYLMPVASDIKSPLLQSETATAIIEVSCISVIVYLHDGSSPTFTALIQSLKSQSLALNLEIIVITDITSDQQLANTRNVLGIFFPEKYFMIAESGMNRNKLVNKAASHASGDFLLFVDQDVILHDRRTLDVMLQMARYRNVASSSCSLLVESAKIRNRSVKYHFGGLILLESGGAEYSCSGLDAYAALSLLTYPVVANTSALMMTRKDVWFQLDGFDSDSHANEDSDLAFGIRAIQTGFYNVCSTVISAGLNSPSTQQNQIADYTSAWCRADYVNTQEIDPVTRIRVLA